MKFLKLDKKKGSGGPSIKSRYAYLIHIDDIDYLPGTNEKGVRLEGDILLKEDCTMMPLYLTSSSQEFSYDILGDDDEKSYLVKFSGNHPGTELEALEFAKNMIEQPFLVLIPSCKESEPWKLLGELTNPLIFTSSHKGGSDSSKFTFNFEQRIGSEFIYFSYGGVEVPSDGGGGIQPPDGGFDPAQWAKIDASNIDPYISQWRAKLGVNSQDRILTIGAVTATTNKAYLALPPELKNEVEIGMVKHSRTVAQQFPFTAVTTGFKVLIIEARPTPEVFHLVEGTEGTEAVEPAHTGLVVAKLLATPTGTTVEESNTDFKQKLEDYWLNWYVTSQSKVILSTYDARGSFYITKSASATGSVTIGGLSKLVPATEDAAKIFYEGREFLIYNATGENLIIDSAGVSGVDTFLIANKLTPYVVKNNNAIKVKIRGGDLELLPSGSDPDLSGYAKQTSLDAEIVERFRVDSLKLDKPTAGNDGEVLIKSGESSLWSSIIKGVEFIGNAWLKLKLISFQGYTIAQKNAIASPNEGMLIYQNESPKGFQKYEGGAWSAIGSNISNADLSNVSARTFTQGNTFTWNTAGFLHYLKGLVDKTGNSAYTKVVVVHPTTGETVTRDFADPQATTLAVQNANAGQKSAMRIALLGSSVPASPIVNQVNVMFVQRGVSQMLFLAGVNLIPLDPTSIYIESGGIRVNATSYYSINNQALQTFWNIPSDFPLGEHFVKLSFGSVVQGSSKGKMFIVDNVQSLRYNVTNLNSVIKVRDGYTMISGRTQFVDTNVLNVYKINTSYSTIDNSVDMVAKTDNVLTAGSSWEIVLDISILNTTGGDGPRVKYIGLTQTTNANINSSIHNLIENYILATASAYHITNPNFQAISAGLATIFVIRKTEDILSTYRFNRETGIVDSFAQITIDDTLNYSLFIVEYSSVNFNAGRQYRIDLKIKN